MTKLVTVAEMVPSDTRKTLDGQGVPTNKPFCQKTIIFSAPSHQYIGESDGQESVRHESENSRNVAPTALLEQRMKLPSLPCCSSDNDSADETANCFGVPGPLEPIGPLIQVSKVTFDRDIGPQERVEIDFNHVDRAVRVADENKVAMTIEVTSDYPQRARVQEVIPAKEPAVLAACSFNASTKIAIDTPSLVSPDVADPCIRPNDGAYDVLRVVGGTAIEYDHLDVVAIPCIIENRLDRLGDEPPTVKDRNAKGD